MPPAVPLSSFLAGGKVNSWADDEADLPSYAQTSPAPAQPAPPLPPQPSRALPASGPCAVYVGNLSYDLTEAVLLREFADAQARPAWR